MKILIFEKRYIVAKGLYFIIKNIENSLNPLIVEDQIQFQKQIAECPPEFLFINQNLIEKIASPKNESKLQYSKIIVITNKKSDFYTNFLVVEKIKINQRKDELLEKISTLILPEIESEKKTETVQEISERETEIVKLIAQGFTNQQIAEKLFLSPHTVITHRKNITNKLGIKTVSGLTIYAILNNLINLSDN